MEEGDKGACWGQLISLESGHSLEEERAEVSAWHRAEPAAGPGDVSINPRRVPGFQRNKVIGVASAAGTPPLVFLEAVFSGASTGTKKWQLLFSAVFHLSHCF